mgnify:CR=1 FL=1
MTIVDNNILGARAKVERLDLLPAVFDSVGTPPSVVDELDRAKAAGYGFVDRIDAVTAHNGGWLTVVSPAGEELELAEDIRDHALSITDARCLAVAATRDRRLVTDDAHVGTVGRQHDIEVWDLVLLLQAAIRRGVLTSRAELSTLVDDLQARDNYRFSTADEQALFETF